MSDESLVEKQVSSESIYQGRVVKLSVDTVQLPNGETSKRELITHPGAVAIVPLDAAGNIIMVRQYRYAAKKVLLELPAGTLNPGENPDLCADRELQEETGLKAGKLEKLGGIYVAPGYSTEYIHLYLATDLQESRLDMDEDEFIEVETVPLSTTFELIREGVINDGKSISGLMLARDRLS
jgi:ADP-ribose pyrophosphatase